MTRKLSLAVAVLAATALMVPSIANAAEVTTEGEALAVGSIIAGVSDNTVVVTEAFGDLPCEEVVFGAELVANGGGVADLEGGEGVAAGCSLNEEEEVEFTELGIEVVELLNPLVGVAAVTFVVDFPFEIACHFEGLDNVTYEAGAGVIQIDGELEGGICGEAEIQADFALASGGVGLVLDD